MKTKNPTTPETPQQQPRPKKPEDLKWLVKSRTQNQKVSADLYELICKHQEFLLSQKPDLQYASMTLVGIGFSLWRAAFLTNKSGKREDTHKAAIDFLSEILETNAINFTQDKKAMDFTFNYYLANVRFRLAELKGGKKDTLGFVFDERLLVKGMLEGDGLKDRWRLYQKAFEDAVNHFKALLSSNRQVP